MLPSPQVILCVDDDADDQFMVHEAIKQLEPSARVATALNGLEALHYLTGAKGAELPSLIIMDINMPLMDGKEAVARIRKEPRFQDIPIVMFTTSSSQLDRTFCEQYNIPFLTKPLNDKLLYTMIEDMLTYGNNRNS